MGFREGRAARRPAPDGFGSPGQGGEALGNGALGHIREVAGVFGVERPARRPALARWVRVRAGKRGQPQRGIVTAAASQVEGWRPCRTQPNWRLQWTGYAAGGSPGELTWG